MKMHYLLALGAKMAYFTLSMWGQAFNGSWQVEIQAIKTLRCHQN